MEHMFKKFLSLAMLLSVGAMIADCGDCDNDCKSNRVITCLTPRSQSYNNVIKNAGLDPDHQFLDDMDCFNGNFSVAVEYSQTFRNDDLAECYWGPAVFCGSTPNNNNNNNNSCNTNCNTSCNNDCDSGCDNNDCVQIRIRGTQAAAATGGTPGPNGTSDLVAENFFLPKTFNSVVSFCPSIRNVNVHFQFYAGLDEWANGMYMRLYAPVTWARWDMDACETVIDPVSPLTAVGFAAGEIAPAEVLPAALYQNFLSYMRGNSITIPGVQVQPLRNAKLACEALTETKLADLRFELGWNFLTCEDYHLGFYLQAAAPTGNDCCDGYIFSPVVGNGHFWELGAGLTSHYTLWRGCDDMSQVDFYLDANVAHMFEHEVSRTFDLVGKPLSRYMIAEQLTTTVSGLTVGAGEANVVPNAQFTGTYAPVANFTTQTVDVSIAAQGEVTAKFVYTHCGFSWELGYDFYGRSCEDIEPNCECTTFRERTWALRGDAQVYGFVVPAEGDATAVALGATRSTATAFSLTGGGTANVVATGTDGTVNNTQIDNRVLAFNAADPRAELRATPTAGNTSTINSSNAAVFIRAEDIDYAGSQTRLISNKIFTHFNYTWIDREDWIPYVGFGVSAEFGSMNHDNDCCDTNNTNTNTTTVNNCNNNDCCDSCETCSPSQWAVWFKGGVSFQ